MYVYSLEATHLRSRSEMLKLKVLNDSVRVIMCASPYPAELNHHLCESRGDRLVRVCAFLKSQKERFNRERLEWQQTLAFLIYNYNFIRFKNHNIYRKKLCEWYFSDFPIVWCDAMKQDILNGREKVKSNSLKEAANVFFISGEE